MFNITYIMLFIIKLLSFHNTLLMMFKNIIVYLQTFFALASQVPLAICIYILGSCTWMIYELKLDTLVS